MGSRADENGELLLCYSRWSPPLRADALLREGLYKGMGAPLATVAAFNAVLFTVRGQMKALLRSEPGAPLTVKQQIVCGAGAGAVVAVLACPTELIKCRIKDHNTWMRMYKN